jgi:acyl-CoA thioesterase-1
MIHAQRGVSCIAGRSRAEARARRCATRPQGRAAGSIHATIALGTILLSGACAASERARPNVAQDSARTTVAADARPTILFFGTSLTAGLGLEPEEAYPALIQEKLDSAGLVYRAVNGGVSGETSAAGLRRIDWLLQQPVAVLVLELGANDALRGQDLATARANLQAIIDRTRARYPDVRIVVAGMEAPPNLGRRYTREFRDLFVTLARDNGATLIPFLLEGVGGVAELNQADGIHPNAAGARIVADNVWRVLQPLVR